MTSPDATAAGHTPGDRSVEALLAAHDDQVRGTVLGRLPDTWQPFPDGRVTRVTTPHQGFAFSDGLHGASVDEIDGYIARAKDLFASRGEAFEWKLYSNDHPKLAERLRAAGFEPEDDEAVMVGLVADTLDAGTAPDGVEIRSTTDRIDLDRIAAMESEVWGEDWSWLAGDLADRIEADPDNIVLLVAEADGHVVSAAWLVVMAGTRFGGLWGGSTLEAWRGRGIYRALVAERARIAQQRGLQYLQVDASDDSRPILERLGMQRVATTRPWIWKPAD